MVCGPQFFLAKLVEKWPKYGKKLFSGPKKGPNSGFWPKKFFRPNWSKNGQNMAKSCFLGLKQVKKVVLGLGKIFVPIGPKMANTWPKVVF